MFQLAAKMVRLSADLSAVVTFRDTAKQLHCPELGTLYRALSADASNNLGLSPSFIVHDELGQVLTVLKLETAMCELAFAGQVAGLDERLTSMKKLIANLFQLVRDVATALRPPILDAGIASAIEWQVRRFEARTQIPCLVEVPDHLPPLSDAKAIGLFRILQEALTNVMRHAGAHSVQVYLRVEQGELCLCVIDDGKGFAQAPRKAGQSFGLVGMQERVLMLGGRLQIDSQPGEGTTLLAHVALDEEALT